MTPFSSRTACPAVLHVVLVALLGLSLPALANAPIGAIDELLAGRHTLKAARLTERALEEATPETALELRYLLLKAHVLDLQETKGDLYRRAVGKGDDGLEEYEALVAGLESDVRSAGSAALPLLRARLEDGDALDRLLGLGLFQQMLEEGSDVSWEEDAASRSAAAGATLAAAEDCTGHESVDPPDPFLEPEAAQQERDAYVQSVYALTSGLDFLSRVDAGAAGRVAAEALSCRAAAGLVIEDRQQLERLRTHLPGPLRQVLARATSPGVGDGVQIDALMLLGRYGDCSDTETLNGFADSEAKAVAAAASAAIRRVRMRLDCTP